jgi:hypothetical protein
MGLEKPLGGEHITMKIILIWGRKFRPWGYEVRVDLIDDYGKIYCEAMTFPVRDEHDAPDEETIGQATKALAARLEAGNLAMAAELAEAPARKAQEVKTEFMSCVSAGLIKGDDLARVQIFITDSTRLGREEIH